MRRSSWLFIGPATVAISWHVLAGVKVGLWGYRLAMFTAAALVIHWARELRPKNSPGLAGRLFAAVATSVLLWLCILEWWVNSNTLHARGFFLMLSAAIVHAMALFAATRPGEGNSRGAQFVSCVLLVASVGTASIAAVEAGLRVVRPLRVYDIQPEGAGPRRHMTQDALGRSVLVPGFRGRTVHPNFPGVLVEINEWGMRDDQEEASPPAPGEASLLVIGDSFVFGIGVSLEETFQERLEVAAAAISKRPLRAYSGGVPGYGTLHARQLLEKLAPHTNPEVVVVTVLEDNDFQDNYWSENGTVESLQQGKKPAPLEEFLTDVRGLRYWVAFCAIVHANGAEKKLVESGLVKPVILRNYFLDLCLQREPPEIVDRMVERVVYQLGEMRRYCEGRGADLVIALVPSILQAEPERYADFVKGQAGRGTEYSRLAFHDGFNARLRAAGFEVVDMLPTLEASAECGQTGFHLDGHWNATGHRLMADELIPVLARHFSSR